MKTIFKCVLLLIYSFTIQAQKCMYVSTWGNDSNEGTIENPLYSLDVALNRIKDIPDQKISIYLKEGTYYLDSSIVITTDKIKNKHVLISAWKNEHVVISGSKKHILHREKGKNGIWETPFSHRIDQLWINGEKKILARYPNYQEKGTFNGTSEGVLSPERIKKWKHPEDGFIHSMHAGMWGSQHYRITGKVGDSLIYEGGYQVSRPSRIHPSLRFVENIREELDTPGEWFWDKKKKVLYYYPASGESLDKADIEISTTPQLIVIRGTQEEPIAHVVLQNLCFTRTNRTFMEPYETLMRSDWGIYRGAAVLLENTKNCRVAGCEFKELGGNAVFLSKYAFNDTIRGNHIHHTGGSAICVVGDTSAVRSGVYGYENYTLYERLDFIPGPKNNRYPRQCLIEDNLIHDLGTVEKQVAGVEIQIAAMIEVRHNSIYDVPRAGINVGDGAFGGHVIEYNDVFNTVLETSDHGAFNSWGRDRFWHPDYRKMAELVADHPNLILLDALYTTIIRNNRFRCDHGWDIDLDDGSSNYHIYNNVCLSGGIKLREGFYRTVENNILINNSLHPHVWFQESKDVIRRNLFMQPYYPISLNGWGEEIDFNFFSTERSLERVQKNQTDKHSVSGKLLFADAGKGDYTLPKECDVFQIGFENIPLDRFGVYSLDLKEKAHSPEFPEIRTMEADNDVDEYNWLGAKIRIIKGLGDRSAFGLPDEKGFVIVDIDLGSPVSKAGLQNNDVIRLVNDEPISSIEEFFSVMEQNKWRGKVSLTIFRNQKEEKKMIPLR